MSTLYKMIFNPRSPLAFLLAFIYSILATIGLFNPYKDFPTPDYPEGSLNYEYSLRADGYDKWYGLTSLQGILNMINVRDKDGLKSKFCDTAKASVDLDRQIDILFNYFDGEIISYEDALSSQSSSAEYGNYHYYNLTAGAHVKTQNYIYSFLVELVVKNDNEGLIGINYIHVVREDIGNNYDKIHRKIPWDWDALGVQCINYNGVIH